ncbi:hypothetical protein GE061_002922 [Apolygus lucorum]|uniref:Uncharacterized protein n=1 Tax=Apolygus lucorum TaxID=248454 RepID=A0A6A4JRM5_APOLU|nr:hypothetical protein GE061_002922 [Apolygus lucorum]
MTAKHYLVLLQPGNKDYCLLVELKAIDFETIAAAGFMSSLMDQQQEQIPLQGLAIIAVTSRSAAHGTPGYVLMTR